MSSFDTNDVLNNIGPVAKSMGVDPAIAQGIILSENSSYGKDGKLRTNPQIASETTSPAGAVGLGQVMPATFNALVAKGLIPAGSDPTDPYVQMQASVAAIKDGMNSGVKPGVETAIYYNGGPKALAAYRAGKPLNPETADYAKKFGEHMGLDNGMDPSINAPTVTPSVSSPSGASTSASVRTGTTTSQKIIPTDLYDKVMDSIKTYQGLSDSTLGQIQGLAGTIIPIADQQSSAVQAGEAAKEQQIEAQRQIDVAGQDQHAAILSRFGMDANNADSIVSRNTALAAQIHSQRADLQAQVAALSTKSPFSDPVGWLMDSIKAEPLINQHNSLLAQENSANNQIQTAQSESAAQETIQPANISNAINARAMADANAAKAMASEKVADITGVARARMAQTLIQTMSVAGGAVANNIRAADLVSTTQHTIATETDKVTDPNGQKYGQVNQWLTSLGFDKFTPEAFKGMDKPMQDQLIQQSQGLNKDTGDMVGLLYRMQGQGIGSNFKNAPDASKFALNLVAAGQKEFDTASTQSQLNPAIKASLARLNKNDPMAPISWGIDSWLQKKQAELGHGDMANLTKDNPFALEKARAAMNPALQDNPVTMAIKAHPEQVPNDQWILSQITAQVVAGTLSAGDAGKAISNFYNTGMNSQESDKAMASFGIKHIGAYPVSARIYGNASNNVDMMNPTAVENLVTRQVAIAKIRKGIDDSPFTFDFAR